MGRCDYQRLYTLICRSKPLNLKVVLSFALLIAAVVGPLVFFAWLVVGTETFLVQAITVVDARPHVTEGVQHLVEQELLAGGRRPTIFFVRTVRLERLIREQFPSVRNVLVQRQLPGVVKIIIQEKTPALLLLTHGAYYFVDEGGVAYERAELSLLPGVVLPTVKNKDASGEVTIGKPVLEAVFVTFVKEVQAALPHRVGAEVVEMYIPSLAAREVSFRLSNNWTIRFDSTASAARQLSILEQVLNDTLSDDEKKQLEYIDLRIPNRVYYRTGL
jgi:cell division septal protein FtsQ